MEKINTVEKYEKMLIAESPQPVKQFWCSMADPNLPKGSQFLGVVIVEARGPATATYELNSRGLNLGGEIRFYELNTANRIPDEWMYRVLDKETLENNSLGEKV